VPETIDAVFEETDEEVPEAAPIVVMAPTPPEPGDALGLPAGDGCLTCHADPHPAGYEHLGGVGALVRNRFRRRDGEPATAVTTALAVTP